MIVTVASRHMEVTPALKTFAESKANKLLKYYDRIQEIEVILDAGKESGKDHTRVEMIVNAEHKNMFIARHSGNDAYACIDGCMDKLERQLTDHKERYRNRKHLDEWLMVQEWPDKETFDRFAKGRGPELDKLAGVRWTDVSTWLESAF